MRPRTLWFAGATLAALGAIVAFGRSTSEPPPASRSSDWSTDRKRAAREFWTAFRSAEALRREGRWADAVPEYRRALVADPRHEGALYYLANCLIELDRFEDALASLTELAGVNPLSQRAYLQIGLVRSSPAAGGLFDLDAAEHALRRAVEINQEETGCLLRLAAVLLVTGAEEEALELYDQVNRSNFRAVEGYYVRACVHWQRGRTALALELLQQALAQCAAPVVVAGIPGEGDTEEGSVLPPSGVDDKRLIKPFWNGLARRFPDGRVTAEALPGEFAALSAWVRELRKR